MLHSSRVQGLCSFVCVCVCVCVYVWWGSGEGRRLVCWHAGYKKVLSHYLATFSVSVITGWHCWSNSDYCFFQGAATRAAARRRTRTKGNASRHHPWAVVVSQMLPVLPVAVWRYRRDPQGRHFHRDSLTPPWGLYPQNCLEADSRSEWPWATHVSSLWTLCETSVVSFFFPLFFWCVLVQTWAHCVSNLMSCQCYDQHQIQCEIIFWRS